jgi:hypothetical protein
MDMNLDEARARLWNHANLPGDQLPPTESLVWVLWDAEQRRVAPDLESLGSDIHACLSAVNHQIKGPLPSARTGIRQDAPAIFEVAYPISVIIEAGLASHRRWSREATFDQAIRDELEELLHRVSFAWCQALAGDVDDLLEGFDP